MDIEIGTTVLRSSKEAKTGDFSVIQGAYEGDVVLGALVRKTSPISIRNDQICTDVRDGRSGMVLRQWQNE